MQRRKIYLILKKKKTLLNQNSVFSIIFSTHWIIVNIISVIYEKYIIITKSGVTQSPNIKLLTKRIK